MLALASRNALPCLDCNAATLYSIRYDARDLAFERRDGRRLNASGLISFRIPKQSAAR